MIVEDNKSRCTGCMACVQKCPFSAINVYLDDEGFYYPEVNKKLCHNCNACAKVCPISAKRTNDIESQSSPIAYACYSKDKFVREQSSSGGLFSLLAKRVLANGGMVVGAAFDKNFNVKHVCIYDDKDLFQIRGSKYVQSDVNNTFIVIREELQSGRNVLFTGTMCQVAGLLHYLGKPYDNLLTIDILCHGVPSVKLWHKYLLEQEDEHNSKIKSISFRNKDLGWRSFSMKIAFLNGSTYSKIFRDDYYMSLYLSNICLRPSCYQCQFKNIVRASDISIGDCWAIDRSSELDNDKQKRLLALVSNSSQCLITATHIPEMMKNERMREFHVVNGTIRQEDLNERNGERSFGCHGSGCRTGAEKLGCVRGT